MNQIYRGLTQRQIKGKDYLFLIGIDKYATWPNLNNAVRDAKALKKVLLERYGFQEKTDNGEQLIYEFYNETATKEAIKDTLEKLRTAGANDRLLIYFSGHGYNTSNEEDGYLITTEIKERPTKEQNGFFKDDEQVLSYSSLKKSITKLDCKHILFIADACYAGNMLKNDQFQSGGVFDMDASKDLAEDRSVWGIFSGMKSVSDGYQGQNSPFARALLDLLTKAFKPFTNRQLYADLQVAMDKHTYQPVEGALLASLGRRLKAPHEQGQYLFEPKLTAEQAQKAAKAQNREREYAEYAYALLEEEYAPDAKQPTAPPSPILRPKDFKFRFWQRKRSRVDKIVPQLGNLSSIEQYNLKEVEKKPIHDLRAFVLDNEMDVQAFQYLYEGLTSKAPKIHILMGPAGLGKTTLLRRLAVRLLLKRKRAVLLLHAQDWHRQRPYIKKMTKAEKQKTVLLLDALDEWMPFRRNFLRLMLPELKNFAQVVISIRTQLSERMEEKQRLERLFDSSGADIVLSFLELQFLERDVIKKQLYRLDSSSKGMDKLFNQAGEEEGAWSLLRTPLALHFAKDVLAVKGGNSYQLAQQLFERWLRREVAQSYKQQIANSIEKEQYYLNLLRKGLEQLAFDWFHTGERWLPKSELNNFFSTPSTARKGRQQWARSRDSLLDVKQQEDGQLFYRFTHGIWPAFLIAKVLFEQSQSYEALENGLWEHEVNLNERPIIRQFYAAAWNESLAERGIDIILPNHYIEGLYEAVPLLFLHARAKEGKARLQELPVPENLFNPSIAYYLNKQVLAFKIQGPDNREVFIDLAIELVAHKKLSIAKTAFDEGIKWKELHFMLWHSEDKVGFLHPIWITYWWCVNFALETSATIITEQAAVFPTLPYAALLQNMFEFIQRTRNAQAFKVLADNKQYKPLLEFVKEKVVEGITDLEEQWLAYYDYLQQEARIDWSDWLQSCQRLDASTYLLLPEECTWQADWGKRSQKGKIDDFKVFVKSNNTKLSEQVPFDIPVDLILPEGVAVPANKEAFERGDGQEKHEVWLSDYKIAKHCVTNRAFAQFVKETGYITTAEREGWTRTAWWEGDTLRDYVQAGGHWRMDEFGEALSKVKATHPAVHVSWWDAIAYCNFLNEKCGLPIAYDAEGGLVNDRGYRLPTEAEWEYAAKGGAQANHLFAGTDETEELKRFANVAFDDKGAALKLKSEIKLEPVASYQANALGLYDMSGNVWEWCQDWYDADYYTHCAEQEILRNPKGPSSGKSRVLRGGSWSDNAGNCRVSYRLNSTPTNRGNLIGFRLVLP